MKLAVLKERRAHEKRVAATPDTIKKFIALGFDVIVEKGAGLGASILDSAFEAAGASIAKDAAATLKDAAVVLKVQAPEANEIKHLPKGAVLASTLNPFGNKDGVEALAKANVTAFSMEFMPRITRAQSMDVLSSQSNLAGYKAVLDAAEHSGKAYPMMMTAA
ncbi:MAG: NAD(P)(+) transhydrogenase (Re/Si-specific) subunit alpha, partial [Sphingomonadales bacterium]|nr:NAD(P)(+) transhydrogenase (Re/Si-specific) subunit alpha [Sphingomonadales bacterium]